mmetsp:Transcript_18511/g.55811  ORF Transcript_18511/g.55811 Transcript_18511/m.55811 type:complete len:214 (-) Transcript_18511:124-765(-)
MQTGDEYEHVLDSSDALPSLDGGGPPVRGRAAGAPRWRLPEGGADLVSEVEAHDAGVCLVASRHQGQAVEPRLLRVCVRIPEALSVFAAAAPLCGRHVVVENYQQPSRRQGLQSRVKHSQRRTSLHVRICRQRDVLVRDPWRHAKDQVQAVGEPYAVEPEPDDAGGDVREGEDVEAVRHHLLEVRPVPVDAGKVHWRPVGIHHMAPSCAERQG